MKQAAPSANRKLSFVIPVFNEQDNLVPLVEELSGVAAGLPFTHEIILIDDGSSDDSLTVIRELSRTRPQLKYLALARNSGQSAALAAGIQAASGEVVVTLDADLQNDPADLAQMLRHYGEYDMVTGWRHNRRDSFAKRIGSLIGNFVRNRMTGETIRDTGCSLKVMRASLLKRIKWYRGLHRFLPTLMRLEGARVIEVKVNHRPRTRGTSKYNNWRRAIDGLYDVLAVRWMIRRRQTVTVREQHLDD